jgi:ParB-like chromosome segregation protein Spo0J
MAMREQEKHMAFYKMRDEIRRAKHCALCSLERKAMHQFFDGLLYERVTDPGMRKALVKSAGFCPRHAHMLAGFGDGLGTAILYEDQLKLRLEVLNMAKSPFRTHRREEALCPACLREEQMRARHVQMLLKGLSDSEMASAFESSMGLCFPHFSLAAEQAEDSAVKSILVRVQAENVKRLLVQLKEFIDKHDYRRTSEDYAEEKDSWMRAVELVSGLKNVF